MTTVSHAVAVLALVSAPALAGASTYEIDATHSVAEFKIRHLMVTNVKGAFAKLSGTLTLDDKDITKSKVEATIDASSIDTRDDKRDQHLRSPDFFDTAKHPTITFKSTKTEKADGGKLKVTGSLTMRGITKTVTLDVDGPTAEITDPRGNAKIGATATTTLSRKDFGVAWNAPLTQGGVVIGDEVAVTLELQLLKKQGPVAGK